MSLVPPIHAIGAAYRGDRCRISETTMPSKGYSNISYGGIGIPPFMCTRYWNDPWEISEQMIKGILMFGEFATTPAPPPREEGS